jgi:hypothetical protein
MEWLRAGQARRDFERFVTECTDHLLRTGYLMANDIEGSLRQALAQRAAEVPAQAGHRLRGLDYHPRCRSRSATAGVAGAGLAVTALAVGGGAYLAGGGPAAAHPATAAARTGSVITLSDYTFKLPAGFKPTTRQCAPLPPGPAGATTVPGNARFAAGAAAHGGCVEVLLADTAVQPPAGASPVQVGPYRGFTVSAPGSQQVTLYVRVPTAQGDRELVVEARNLPESHVLQIAARALSVPYGPAKG